MLTSLPSSMFLATCCVMVEAPIGRRPLPYIIRSADAGAGDGERVDAAMGPELLVLGRDEGLLQHVRDRADRHEDAPLGGELGQQPLVPGIDPAHHLRLVLPQPVQRRQLGRVALRRCARRTPAAPTPPTSPISSTSAKAAADHAEHAARRFGAAGAAGFEPARPAVSGRGPRTSPVLTHRPRPLAGRDMRAAGARQAR